VPSKFADPEESNCSAPPRRDLDTLHVASALELKAERFWTFDERQKRLARAVGLKTVSRI